MNNRYSPLAPLSVSWSTHVGGYRSIGELLKMRGKFLGNDLGSTTVLQEAAGQFDQLSDDLHLPGSSTR
jgi:hypothetical protein